MGGTKMEYTEYEIKIACSRFNWKWNFAQHFYGFYSFHTLGSARMLLAIIRQHVAYLPKALHIVALGLLNTLILVTNIF